MTIPRKMMMAMVLFGSVIIGVTNIQAAIIQSTFDSGDEGWTIHEVGAANLYWSNVDGNPGGYISAEDMDVTNMYIAAPGKFLGDLIKYDGGIFSFDAIELENALEPWFKFGVVEFYNVF